MSLSRLSARCRGYCLDGQSPAGDGGDDAQRVSGGDGGGFLPGKVTDVFVVQINIHKGADFALGGEEVLAQIGVRLGELVNGAGNRGRVDLDGALALGVGAEGRGNEDLHDYNFR